MPEPKGKKLTGSLKNYAMTFKIWTLRMIKSRIRWVGHATHIINNRSANWKERDHLKGLGVGGKIILKWILHRMGGHELDVWRSG